MIRHFFLDKTNTIVEQSHQNMGLNPILSLSYGREIMRGILHFDVEEIKSLINDKTFADINKLSFSLKMTNCLSIVGAPYEKELIRGNNHSCKKASSFDLMLFKLPCEFDAGRGYDYVNDFWKNNKRSFTENGSNWFQSRNLIPWVDYSKNFKPEEYNPKEDEGGIYSMQYLKDEYDAFIKGEETIIIGVQHFDFGDENLCIDITKYVLECVNSGNNYGLCLAFTPLYEQTLTEASQCVDFFTDNTNTFFHPYVEAIYDEYIIDRRNFVTNSSDDKLYLYVYNDDVPSNLDKIPTCSIDGIIVPVTQISKGVYCAMVSNKNIALNENTIYYDKWTEIYLNDEKLEDVEMEFFVSKKNKRLNIGSDLNVNKMTPSVYGINDGEKIIGKEIRTVNIDFIKNYTQNKSLVTTAKYRLYVKDGNSEINVIPYHQIEMCYNTNFFNIYTMDLIPNEYFIDIQITVGREVKTYKNVLRFEIVNDATERY